MSRGGTHNVEVSATDDWSLPFTCTGITPSSGGTWTAKVRTSVSAESVALALTVTVVGQIVTVSATAAELAALIPSGKSQFTGVWSLHWSSTGFTYVKASQFVVHQEPTR